MAIKSIVDIDLNLGKFQEFKKLFDNYEKMLKGMPGVWEAMNKKVDGTRKSFDKMTTAAIVQNVQARLQEKAQEHADRVTRTTAERWLAMARSSREVAGNIKNATVELLRWGSLTGIVSGLIGGGGLYGIDRMALGVASNRRASLGLGIGYGDRTAFSANFSRLVDPDSFLSGVAGAKLDVTRRVGLIGAGLSPGEIGGDTGTTAVALLRHLKSIADQTDPALFAQVIQSRRLDQFVSPEDLQRLRNTSLGEFNQLVGQYGARRGTSSVDPQTALRWQDFVTQLGNAGAAINATFVRGLVPLAPGLSKLSDSVEKVIRAFLDSPALERWIKAIDEGLEKFAGYIGTDEFQNDVRTFVQGVGAMAETVGAWLKWAAPKAGTVVGAASGAATLGGIAKDLFTGNIDLWGTSGATTTPGKVLDIIRKLEGSKDSEVSPAGAIGRYQIMPGTAAQYGGDASRLTDPVYSRDLARKIITDLIKRYHGNTAEVLAAYNGGPGAANKFRDAGDNLSVLPRETQKYVTNGRGMDGYAPTVVTIENNTGGNANVSVNGLKN